MSLYERLMAGEDVAFEDALTEAWRATPWMSEDGVELLRQAIAVYVAGLMGEEVDERVMVGAFEALAEQAEGAGDQGRADGFRDLSVETCAVLQVGTEAAGPMPVDGRVWAELVVRG